MSILTENWYTWYHGIVDSESGLRFLKFRPQNSFLGKFDTHGILTMLILIPTLVLWISDPKFIFEQMSAKKVKIVHFAWKLVLMLSRGCFFLSYISFLNFENLNPLLGKFGPKNSKLFSLAENWHTECLDDVHSYSDNTFLSFKPLILFWTNLGRKIQSYSFWLKIGTHGISRMQILIPTRVFWTANPKSICGKIWAKKVKAICFAWKLAHTHIHTVSRRCWFLFPY